jgi:hypothetical protein
MPTQSIYNVFVVLTYHNLIINSKFLCTSKDLAKFDFSHYNNNNSNNNNMLAWPRELRLSGGRQPDCRSFDAISLQSFWPSQFHQDLYAKQTDVSIFNLDKKLSINFAKN